MGKKRSAENGITKMMRTLFRIKLCSEKARRRVEKSRNEDGFSVEPELDTDNFPEELGLE